MGSIYWIPAALMAAAIFFFSHQSRPPGRSLLVLSDITLHFLAYGFFAVTLSWGATRGLRVLLSFPRAAFVVLAASIYGISDEWHQSFVAHRSASLADWIADSLGALVLTSALYYYRRQLVRN